MNLNKEITDLIIIASIAFGSISCFFGYRIFRLILGILGFFLGALAAGGIAFYLTNGSQIIVLIAALAGGIIGAGIFALLYFVGIFVLGAILGGLIGTLISTALGGSLQFFIQIILAIVGGVIALIFQKFMIIIATAFSGSWSIVTGIYYFITGDLELYRMFQHPGNLFIMNVNFYIMLLCWLILAIIGIVIQYKITQKRPYKEKYKPKRGG
jgi:hypothetical protein